MDMKNTDSKSKRYTTCTVCGKGIDRNDVSVDVRFADDGLSGKGPRALKCASHVK
jgi:hypothetical protein